MSLLSRVPEVPLLPPPIEPRPRPMRDELWTNKYLVECWSSKSANYTDETERALANQSVKTQELVLKEACLFHERERNPRWERFR